MTVMVVYPGGTTVLRESRLEVALHLSEVLLGLGQVPGAEILSYRGEVLLNGAGSRRAGRVSRGQRLKFGVRLLRPAEIAGLERTSQALEVLLPLARHGLPVLDICGSVNERNAGD